MVQGIDRMYAPLDQFGDRILRNGEIPYFISGLVKQSTSPNMVIRQIEDALAQVKRDFGDSVLSPFGPANGSL